jgi:E3 ubiquitin-protein ligase BRE1
MKLQDEVAKLQQSQTDLENRLHTTSVALRQQEAVISQLVEAERKCRAELQAQKLGLADAQGKQREMELALQQADQKKAEAEHRSEAQVKRNEELFDRCRQMQGKLETERKTRMNAQREARSKAKKQDGAAAAAAGAGGDEGMLNMTLEMLRCSVCHDRFKEVAITRCYHLFCKECIDVNLANRYVFCYIVLPFLLSFFLTFLLTCCLPAFCDTT